MNSWIGKSEGELVSSWGAPQNVYTLSDGSRVLTYYRARNVQIGGYSYQQPTTLTTTGNVYGSGGGSATYNARTATYQTVTTPAQNIQMQCTVNWTITSSGVIQRWSSQGNDCRA